MGLPLQNIPENKKTPDWIKTCSRYIRQEVDRACVTRKLDKECRALWTAEHDQRQWDYLRKYGTYELPAQVRFIPLIRQKGERLKGEYIDRPFEYTVFAIDERSIKQKLARKEESVLTAIRANILDQYYNIQKQIQDVDKFKQMIAQQGQMDPAIPGQVAQPGGTQMVIPPEAAVSASVYGDVLQMQGFLTKKDIDKIEENMLYSSREFHETIMQEGLKFLRLTHDLDKIFYDGMESKIVTDKPVFIVDWDNAMEDPYIRSVQCEHFFYAADNEIDYTSDAEWQAFDYYMSGGNVISRWRYEMSDEVLAALQNKFGFNTVESGFLHGGDWWTYRAGGLYSSVPDISNLARVTHTFFRSPRAITWKNTPNKFLPGEYHSHIVDDSEINPPDRRMEGEFYERFWIDDIYESIMVDDIFIRTRRKPVVLRSVQRYGEAKLPGVAIAWNSKGRRPYSRVGACKDIQVLWNIMHYHKELMVALAGGKGVFMDESQVPDGMSPTEWRYQRKLGTAYIQTAKKGRATPTYNQFKEYDDSLGQGITYIIQVLEHLEQLCSSVIGVNPARMGEASPYEKVGTTDRKIKQSTLATESIYWEYDLVKQKALERLINLCRLAWRKGRSGAYVDPETMGHHILQVPPEILFNSDYKLYVKDASKEMKVVDAVRQIAVGQKSQGAPIPLSQVAAMFTTDSILQLQKKIENYERVTNEQAQASQQAQAQQAQDGAMQQIKYKAQLDAEAKKAELELKTQIESANLKIKEALAQIQKQNADTQVQKVQTEGQIKQMMAQLENYRIDSEKKVKIADIESQRTTEFAYLAEQKREFDIEAANNVKDQAASNAVVGKQLMDTGTRRSVRSGGKEKIKDS